MLGASMISSAEPVPAVNLIESGRNMPALNSGNFNPDQLYTVAAPSGQATQFHFKLKGYVFGLRMIKANYTGYFDGYNYAAYTDLKTSGLGAMLKKLEICYDKALRKVDVDIVPPLGSQGIPAASPAERFAANDTISAVLSLMLQGGIMEGDLCKGSVPVFDSKQHYNLRMERLGPKRVKLLGKKVDGVKCHVYYEPVSGFDPEDLPEQEEEATPVNVYFTKHAASNMWVPVKFTYKISSIKATIKVDEMQIITPQREVASNE